MLEREATRRNRRGSKRAESERGGRAAEVAPDVAPRRRRRASPPRRRSSSTPPTIRPTPCTSPPATRCCGPAGARRRARHRPTPPPSRATTTIFIDDRPTGETISLEAATSATRIEPRLRERRIAVRRAEGRKRLRWALVAAVVVVVVVAALAVLGSSLFAIDDVEVEGAVYTDQAALAAVVEELGGTPVLRADTERRRARRSRRSRGWRTPASRRTSPTGPRSRSASGRPVATFEGPDGAFRVIDTHGRVLDVLDGQPVEYLLVISADAPGADRRPVRAAGVRRRGQPRAGA